MSSVNYKLYRTSPRCIYAVEVSDHGYTAGSLLISGLPHFPFAVISGLGVWNKLGDRVRHKLGDRVRDKLGDRVNPYSLLNIIINLSIK